MPRVWLLSSACYLRPHSPKSAVITTPNAERPAADLQPCRPASSVTKIHQIHRFEWTRAQFATWARGVAERFGYSVTFVPVGPEDPAVVGNVTDANGVFSK